MRNLRILVLSIFLVFSIGFSASIVLANAFSETFTVETNVSDSRSVEVEAGDHIVGDCTFDYYQSHPNENLTYAYTISKISDTAKNIIFARHNEEHTTFDITCDYTGNYFFHFYNHLDGNFSVTLNYQVLKSTEVPAGNNQEESNNILLNSTTWIIVLVGIALISAIAITVYMKKKRNS